MHNDNVIIVMVVVTTRKQWFEVLHDHYLILQLKPCLVFDMRGAVVRLNMHIHIWCFEAY